MRLEGDDGRAFEFTPHESRNFHIEPLGFDELTRVATEENPSVPVVVTNANAPMARTGKDVDGPLRVQMAWGNNGRVLAYGLVPGGWTPLPWAHRGVALLDKNCLVELEKLRASDPSAASTQFSEWLGLTDEEVSPVLFALEGKHQRPPTDFEMRVELQRARKALGLLLSGAKVATVGKAQRRGLQRMLHENAEARGKATRLLIRACPAVIDRPKPAGRERRAAEVLAMAAEEGVRRDSLVSLALLSCIYDQPSKHKVFTPGRAVLKPKRTYTREDAFNALMDLWFLELLLNAAAISPDKRPVLYTRDVGLAAFWVGLSPTAPVARRSAPGKARTTAIFSFHPSLFPDVAADEMERLRELIEA